MYGRIGEGWGFGGLVNSCVVWCTMMLVKGKPRLPKDGWPRLIRISAKTYPAAWQMCGERVCGETREIAPPISAISFDKRSCITKLCSILPSTISGLNSWSYCLGRLLLPSYHFYFASPCSVHPVQSRYELPQLEEKKVASIPPYAIEANSSNTVIMQIADLGLRRPPKA